MGESVPHRLRRRIDRLWGFIFCRRDRFERYLRFFKGWKLQQLRRLSSHGQFRSRNWGFCRTETLYMRLPVIWECLVTLWTHHTLDSSIELRDIPKSSCTYEFEVIINVLIIRTEKLNKYSVGVAEQHSLARSVGLFRLVEVRSSVVDYCSALSD